MAASPASRTPSSATMTHTGSVTEPQVHPATQPFATPIDCERRSRGEMIGPDNA